MGFCSRPGRPFLLEFPQMEKYAVEGGIVLIRPWLEVGLASTGIAIWSPIDDPLRQLRRSPTDIEILAARHDHSETRDLMLGATTLSMHHGISSALTTSEGLVPTAFRTFWNTFLTSVYHAAVSNFLRGPKRAVQ